MMETNNCTFHFKNFVRQKVKNKFFCMKTLEGKSTFHKNYSAFNL